MLFLVVSHGHFRTNLNMNGPRKIVGSDLPFLLKQIVTQAKDFAHIDLNSRASLSGVHSNGG